MRLNELKQRRSHIVGEMRSLVAEAEKAGRDLTDDENQRFGDLKTEERNLGDKIERAEYLSEAERRAAGTPVSDGASRDYDRLAAEVSVLDVLRAQMEGRSLSGAAAEYAQEAERRTGRKAQGVFVPMQALERRNDTTTAAEIVPDDHRPSQYINALRNRLLARRLGVRVLAGLSGNVVIPKHGSGTSVGWVAENGSLDESGMTFDTVSLSPKHAGGISEMSRQLIQQSSPDIEALVRDDLAFMVAQAIDTALIQGGGTNEPTGILSATGTQSHSLESPDWTGVNAMLEKLELANVDGGQFLTSPQVAQVLRTTEKSEGTGAYLLDGGRMANRAVSVTNQVPLADEAGRLILGDFSQVMLGIWSEIDLLVNPYDSDAYSRGAVKIRAMSTVDVAIRHPEAFVIADDVVIG